MTVKFKVIQPHVDPADIEAAGLLIIKYVLEHPEECLDEDDSLVVCANCGHLETEHETVEYRGDKPRYCQHRMVNKWGDGAKCVCAQFKAAEVEWKHVKDMTPEERNAEFHRRVEASRVSRGVDHFGRPLGPGVQPVPLQDRFKPAVTPTPGQHGGENEDDITDECVDTVFEKFRTRFQPEPLKSVLYALVRELRRRGRAL